MLKNIIIIIYLMLNLNIYKAYAQDYSDSEIKAFWIYNLIDYLDWKDRDKNNNFKICTVGLDSVYTYLNNIYNSHKSNFIVVNKNPESNFSECYMLYISTSEKHHYIDLLDNIQGKSILTISSIKGFAKMGGMIEFVMQRNSVFLRINLTSVNDSKILIDSDVIGWSETLK